MIYCSGYYINESGLRDEELTARAVPQGTYTCEDVLLNQVSFFSTSGVMLRKTCLNQVGLFDESLKFYEDVDLWFRVLVYFKAHFLDEELVINRGHAANFARTQSRYPAVDSYKSYLQMRRKAVALFERERRRLTARELERALYRHQLDYIKECLAQGLRAECRGEIFTYFQSHRWSPRGYLCLFLSVLPGNIASAMIQQRRKRMAQEI